MSVCKGQLELFVAFVVALACPVFACAMQGDIADRLVGRWEASSEKTKAYQDEREDSKKFPDGFLDQMPHFGLELTELGKVNITMKKPPNDEMQTFEGKWELVEETDKDRAILHVTMVVEDRDDSKDVNVEFLDDGTMAFGIADEPTLVFVRAKADSSKSEPDKSESD